MRRTPGDALRIVTAGRAFTFRTDPLEPTEYTTECVACRATHTAADAPAEYLLWMADHAASTGHTDYASVELRSLIVTGEGSAA